MLASRYPAAEIDLSFFGRFLVWHQWKAPLGTCTPGHPSQAQLLTFGVFLWPKVLDRVVKFKLAGDERGKIISKLPVLKQITLLKVPSATQLSRDIICACKVTAWVSRLTIVRSLLWKYLV